MIHYNEKININNNQLISLSKTINGMPLKKRNILYQDKTVTPSSITQTIAADSEYDGLNSVTILGDEGLTPENIKKYTNIFGVEGTFTGDIYTYSDEEDAIISRTLSGIYINDRITTIGNNTFAYCSNLISVSFPVATSIGNNTFAYCSNLISVSFPVATSIGGNAFANCDSLTSVNFPKVTTINYNAFYSCNNLTSVSFPVATSIGGNAFANCDSLTSVNFPKVTTIGDNTFTYCYSLTSVSFPIATSIGNYAFNDCYSLTSISFPVCTSIGKSAFYNCYNLSSLTLGASTVCTLSNSNAFTSTPYAGYSSYFSGIPVIYVPASLLVSYQTATNWTYFSSYFSAIEEKTNLITFTIDGVEYQAENGMNWYSWSNSHYNTIGLSQNLLGFIIQSDGKQLYNNNNMVDENLVHENDFIRNGDIYYFM